MERIGGRAKGPVSDVVDFVGSLAESEERKAQAEILRGLAAYPATSVDGS